MRKHLFSLLVPTLLLACDSGDAPADSADAQGDTGSGSGDVAEADTTDAGNLDDTTEDTDIIDVSGDTMADGSGDTSTDAVDDTEADVVVETFALGGTVSIRGRGVAGITIRLEGEADGGWQLIDETVTSLDDGSYRFEDVGAGNYRVTPATAHHTYSAPYADVALAAETTNVDFTLTGALPPTSADFWGATTSDTALTLAPGGALVSRTAYPVDERDWYRFELSEGSAYEFFTTFVDERNDTEIYLYEGSGDSLVEIDSNDDFIDYDSRLTFAPEVAGTYLLAVQHLDGYCHTGTYLFGVDVLNDPDDDGYGDWHDCDQDDDRIYPGSSWLAGEDTSAIPHWRCDNIEAPDPTSNDAFEDDTRETAPEVPRIEFSFEERIYNYLVADAVRTISGDDEDWFKVVVPARSSVGLNGIVLERDGAFVAEYYEGSGAEPFETETALPDYTTLNNESDESVEYFVRVTRSGRDVGATLEAAYIIVAVDFGTDSDGDSYFTRSYYYNSPDTDDADGDVTFCTESEGTGEPE